MSTDDVATFESALADLADEFRRVERSALGEALADHVIEPAVGVPLPYEGEPLAAAGVETDWDAADLRAARTGVTPVGLGIAEYGTVTVRSTAAGDELVSLYADRHVAVVDAADVVPDMAAAFGRLSEEFEAGQRTQILATGPSATGDMGGLIRGVHGPDAVHVVVVE